MDFRDYDTRLAAYAVVVDGEDRVLLALWNEGEQPAWTLPGGGVDLHETVPAAAVREVREETGYDLELAGVLGVDSFVVAAAENADARGRPYKSVRVIFEGLIAGGELTHETEGTTDEARWIPLGEVPALPRVPLVDAALELWRASRLER